MHMDDYVRNSILQFNEINLKNEETLEITLKINTKVRMAFLLSQTYYPILTKEGY